MTKDQPFDFSDLRPLLQAEEEGIDVTIVHPVTGDKLCKIRICGPDSTQARMAHRYAAQLVAMGRIASRNPLSEEPEWTDQDEEDYRIAVLAASTVSWEHVYLDKEPLAHSRENAHKFLSEFRFVATQLNVVASNRTNFIKS